jgi:WD40 repeat protein
MKLILVAAIFCTATALCMDADKYHLVLKLKEREKAANNVDPDPVVLTGHTGVVLSLDYNKKNLNQLASGSFDGTIKLWDSETGECTATFDTDTAINALKFSPNGEELAAGGQDGSVQLWNVETGQKRTLKYESYFDKRKLAVICLAYRLGTSHLFSGSTDADVTEWNTKTGEWRGMLGTGDGYPVNSLISDPNHPNILVYASSKIHRWAYNGTYNPDIKHFPIPGYNGPIACSLDTHDASDNAPDLALGTYNRGVTVMNSADGTIRRTFGTTANIVALAYDSTGQQLATASPSNIAHVEVFNPKTGKLLWDLGLWQDGGTYCIGFNPNNPQQLAAGLRSGEIFVWALENQTTDRQHSDRSETKE